MGFLIVQDLAVVIAMMVMSALRGDAGEGSLLAEEGATQVLGVEFDPEAARAMRRRGLPVRYGDGVTSEFLETLPLAQTRWVVSTLPDMASNRDLLRGLRELRFAGSVALVAREGIDADALMQLGVSTVLYPIRNAVDYAVESLTAIIRIQGETP